MSSSLLRPLQNLQDTSTQASEVQRVQQELENCKVSWAPESAMVLDCLTGGSIPGSIVECTHLYLLRFRYSCTAMKYGIVDLEASHAVTFLL